MQASSSKSKSKRRGRGCWFKYYQDFDPPTGERRNPPLPPDKLEFSLLFGSVHCQRTPKQKGEKQGGHSKKKKNHGFKYCSEARRSFASLGCFFFATISNILNWHTSPYLCDDVGTDVGASVALAPGVGVGRRA